MRMVRGSAANIAQISHSARTDYLAADPAWRVRAMHMKSEPNGVAALCDELREHYLKLAQWG